MEHKGKKYELPEEEPQMVSEAVVARKLGTLYMQNYETMPCTCSDEEFKEELALSEASGFVSNEEFKESCFKKWGVEL